MLSWQRAQFRGYIRESTFTLTYAWRTRKLLFLESIMCELTIPFLAFGLMADLILTIVRYPDDFLSTILPYWLLFMAVRYSPAMLRAPKKIGGLLIYAVFMICSYTGKPSTLCSRPRTRAGLLAKHQRQK